MYDKQRVDYLLRQPRTGENVNELISLNFGLLNKQLKKFYLLYDPDALSLGYEALYNAILTFDLSNGSKFSTYATVCIFNRLGSYVRSLKNRLANTPVFYETRISEHLRLVDILEHPEKVDTNLSVKEIHYTISKCYYDLTNTLHRKIILAWISSEFTMSTTDVGKAVGCSQVYASTVIKQFKTKLEVMLK